MTDTLKKFLFEDASVRGELVELSESWQQVLARRSYPPAVQAVLGQMMAAAALLSANLKFNGALIMQIHGDGPVSLLVVECDAQLRMRATAKLVADSVIDDDASFIELVNQQGNGRFAITLDPKDKLPGQQAYQGIVPLDGATVAASIEHYMQRSEQLDTRLWLAADGEVARGLLLQKLPSQGGISHSGRDHDEPTWDRVAILAATLQETELLGTGIQTLMQRLFWQETLHEFDPLHPQFHCSCDRKRVGNMLKMLGRDEVEAALEELGQLHIDCDFCGQHYQFDKIDCAQLFAGDASAEPPEGGSTH